MFLSIVIPIWNDEKYLNECLDSCLDQKLSGDQYEVICVDDGSTDRTPDILREYAENHSNLVVISKQHGTEFGYGRDIGLSCARGDYVWFVDHDDIIAPDAVDQLLKLALDNSEYDRIVFPYYEFFDRLSEKEWELYKSGELQPNESGWYQDLALWAGIIRISFLKEHDIVPHSNRIAASAAFWGIDDYRIWGGDNIFLDECFDKGIKTLRVSGRPLYHYRRHENAENLSNEPAMFQRRMAGRLNTGLLWAYLAYQQKQIYFAERTKFGRASSQTTEKLVAQISRTAVYLADLPAKQRQQGLKRIKEKDIFFTRIPEEYTVSFKDYWNKCSKKERLLPSTVARYFVITECGTRLYWFLTWPFRFRRYNAFLYKCKEKRRQKRLVRLGTEKRAG